VAARAHHAHPQERHVHRLKSDEPFFVNDGPGFESNNVGTATVSIRSK
jgi:hypothetical protein